MTPQYQSHAVFDRLSYLSDEREQSVRYLSTFTETNIFWIGRKLFWNVFASFHAIFFFNWWLLLYSKAALPCTIHLMRPIRATYDPSTTANSHVETRHHGQYRCASKQAMTYNQHTKKTLQVPGQTKLFSTKEIKSGYADPIQQEIIT